MDNIIYGIVTVAFVFSGYYLSLHYFLKSNYKIAILFLVISGLLLRIYTSTDFYLHTWDERYHALVAKNLLEHPFIPTLYEHPILPYDYKDWTGNYIWLHKQPMPLWVIAFSLKVFGINEIAVRLPSIILSTLGILLTFKIGRYLFSRRVGYLAAFLFSINGLVIELTGGRVATDHIDIFFLFFIELAVFLTILFVQKKKTFYNILAGISIGAAILTKWLPALIVIPIWILLVYDSRKMDIRTSIIQFLILVTSCIAVALPWQIYIFKIFPLEANWESNYNYRHFYEIIEEKTGSIFYYFNKLRVIFGELIYLPLIFFIWKWFKDPYNLKRLALILWFLIPFIFFSIAKTKMQGYILFTAPALFIITAYFFFAVNEIKQHTKLKWINNLILLLLIILPVRYMIERVKPFEKRERNPQWAIDLRDLNRKEIKNGILFNYERPIEAMFYTDLTVYSRMPDKKSIENIINKGFNVFVNDDVNLSQDILEMNDITILRLNE